MSKFVFRGNQNIGAAGAEEDSDYLSHCFVNTGLLDILRDCGDPRRILTGRTGSGKTALLERLGDVEDQVIRIAPEDLALSYVSNSGILNFFAEAGVDLNIFYRLLWRHVFVVEVLKRKFNVDDEARGRTWLASVANWMPKGRKNEVALDYLRKWGGDNTFWRDPEDRIKELTTKVETELKGAINGKVAGVGELSASAGRKLTQEQKNEVIDLTREVVSQVQIRELARIMDFLDDVLDKNRQQRFYLTIDKLDEAWVEDKLRLLLIRALIQTAIDFGPVVHNVKIIVALRTDLLDRVYRANRGSGFQEEKYQSSSLELIWSYQQLISVLDKRIAWLMKDQYTQVPPTHVDVLPSKVPTSRKQRQTGIDYLLDRTLMRPRDVIQFFNQCIIRAEGKTNIAAQTLREAEGSYSKYRFRALLDEWVDLYPNLACISRVLKGRPDNFRINTVELELIEALCLETVFDDAAKDGLDLVEIRAAINSGRYTEFRNRLFFIFNTVGLVGLKTDPGMPVSWAFMIGPTVSLSEITEDTIVVIHKAFWRNFGVRPTGGID